MRPRVLTDAVRAEVVALRKAGYSWGYIAHKTGLYANQIQLILTVAGLIGKVETVHRKPRAIAFPDAEPMVG